MRFLWIIALGLLSAIGLAGCASTNTATEPASLDGSAWVLASLRFEGGFIEFRQEDGALAMILVRKR